LAKEKPPIFGMIQRGGEVVIRMLANVKQVTIKPLIERAIAKGTLVYTDEYDIYSRLVEWGYGHETVCHAAGSWQEAAGCPDWPIVGTTLQSIMSLRFFLDAVIAIR
jgi:ISXO2-like transposase domain